MCLQPCGKVVYQFRSPDRIVLVPTHIQQVVAADVINDLLMRLMDVFNKAVQVTGKDLCRLINQGIATSGKCLFNLITRGVFVFLIAL